MLSPAARTPFLLDDYMHASMADGSAGLARGPFDLYDFVRDQDREVMLERGLLPWWSHPRLTIRFLRPLSSLLRWVELKWAAPRAPEHALAMHLHSLLWWAAAVLAAWGLFRRALPPRAALLATAIFALGPWHVLPVGWLANREVLLALTFGTLALTAHARFRETGAAGQGLLATGLFALACASGEYALCFGGYVGAIELWRRDRLLRRAVGLLPFLAPAAATLAVHALGRYGSHGSSFYTDPLREPLKLLAAAPPRAVTLLAESWLTMGTSAWGTTAPRGVVVTLVLGVGGLLAIPLRRALEALDGPGRARAGWLLLGSFGALVPVLAVVPAPRLLGVSALGVAAVVALLLDHAWFPPAPPPRRGAAELTGLVATLMGFLHLVHGPAAALLSGETLRRSSLAYAASTAALARHLAPEAAAREVAVIRGDAGMFFGPFALAAAGAAPARWRILAHASHVLVLRRDARTVELVAPPAEGLFPDGPANLFRDRTQPLGPGARLALPDLSVEILAAGPRGPTRARFTFARPLEALTFIDERPAGFRVVALPRVGFGAPFDR